MKFNRRFEIKIILLLFFAAPYFIDASTSLELFEEGIDHFEDKEWNEAKVKFNAFIKQNPYEYEVRDAFFYLGEIARNQKEYFDAISYYSKLQKRYPHNRYRKEILYLFGNCYYELKITQRSEYYLKEYLNQEKKTDKKNQIINAYMILGQLMEDSRQWKNATKYYQNALRLLEAQNIGMSENEKNKAIQKAYYKLGLLFANKFRKNHLAYSYLLRSMQLGKIETPKLKFLLRKLTLINITNKEGLPDNAVADIRVDGDDVWVVTWGRGLARFSRSREIFDRISLPSSQLRSAYVDFDNLYLASYDGIFVYDKKKSRVYSLNQKEKMFTLAQKVIKDDRYIYFTTLSNGAVKYDIYKKSIEILDVNSFIKTNYVYSIVADHQYIAFGTLENGVIIKDKKNNEILYLNKKNGFLKEDNIKALFIDGRYLWIGVHKAGIYRYDMIQKKIKSFDWGIPFPTTIAKKDKEIWIGTSGNGIRIFNRETEKIEKLRAIEGLSSNEVTMIRIEDDFVWIGYLDSGIDILYRPENEYN
ncbi:MAG: tetratricopeptide repeat protein [Spirochaetia bacterium]|nr:tetratricopeptide repeat protein [Spirochaetia bacterium]